MASIALKRIVTLLAVLSVALSPSASAGVSPKSRKADKIIKKHIKALGGLAKINALKSFRATGYLEQQKVKIPFTLWMKRPNMSRLEIVLRGRRIIQVYDGHNAWWINPFLGAKKPTKMPDGVAVTIIHWSEFGGPLVEYRKKRHEVEYAGKVDLGDGVTAYKIKLILADGNVWHVYIDAETMMETKRVYVQTFRGKSREVTTSFDEYTEVDGVMVPRVVKGVGIAGAAYTMRFQAFETNIDVDDGQFKMDTLSDESRSDYPSLNLAADRGRSRP